MRFFIFPFVFFVAFYLTIGFILMDDHSGFDILLSEHKPAMRVVLYLCCILLWTIGLRERLLMRRYRRNTMRTYYENSAKNNLH